MLALRAACPLVCVALLILTLAPPARATSVAEMSLEEMAAFSPTIVHGTVVSAASRWNTDHTLIVTDVAVRVENALKGDAPGVVVFSQPGGAVGKLRVEVPGAAPFRPGEETVLFLAPGPAGALHVAGLDRGRFEVGRDRTTGRRIIRGLTPDRLISLGVAPPGEEAGIADAEPVTLDRFLRGVRRIVRDAIEQGGN